MSSLILRAVNSEIAAMTSRATRILTIKDLLKEGSTVGEYKTLLAPKTTRFHVFKGFLKDG